MLPGSCCKERWLCTFWLTDFRDDLVAPIIHGDSDRILPLESTAARLPLIKTVNLLSSLADRTPSTGLTDQVNPLLLDFLQG